jgi:hypothetical protein
MKEIFNAKEFQRQAALMNMQGPIPTPDQIKDVISIIEERLTYKPISRYNNAGVKEGYVKAVEILKSGQADFNKVDLTGLKTIQGRAIASISCDYLIGRCKPEVLCGIPIKD